jgi:hypothetical protein
MLRIFRHDGDLKGKSGERTFISWWSSNMDVGSGVLTVVTTYSTILCSAAEVHQCFGGSHCPYSINTHYSSPCPIGSLWDPLQVYIWTRFSLLLPWFILNPGAACSSKTWAKFYQTARGHIPQDSTLNKQRWLYQTSHLKETPN